MYKCIKATNFRDYLDVYNACSDVIVTSVDFETITSYGQVFNLTRMKSNLKNGPGSNKFLFRKSTKVFYIVSQNGGLGMIKQIINTHNTVTKEYHKFFVLTHPEWYTRSLYTISQITNFEKNFPDKMYGYRYGGYLFGLNE